MDIFINSFLKQEGLEADKKEMLKELLDEVKALNEELASALPLTRTHPKPDPNPDPKPNPNLTLP